MRGSGGALVAFVKVEQGMQGCPRPLGNDEQRLRFPFDKSSVPLPSGEDA